MSSEVNSAVKRALISVSDRTGVIELATQLNQLGIEILSTGGTGRILQEQGIPVIEIAQYTGFPEIMGGRVKTLHPKVHGGLLGRRDIDAQVMQEYGIQPIDLLIVNLYPFQKTISKPDCTYDDAIENIDIGGPAMIRAAAKNHAAVAVVVNPADYSTLLSELNHNKGKISFRTRQEFAQKAYAHTAQYDAAIANYLQKQLTQEDNAFPAIFNAQWQKQQDLRYGENPHQKAAFYTDAQPPSGSIAAARQLQGKELSFNNIADADAALECIKAFPIRQAACVIVKHANPCGVALGTSLLDAYKRAFETDPTSAFGGIIAFNQDLDATTLTQILDKQFVEVIIAPSISGEAKNIAMQKPNVRLLECGEWPREPSINYHLKQVTGGMLIQEFDVDQLTLADLKVVTKRAPTDEELRDLLFAWKVARFVKSNAIVYAKSEMTYGVGAGQMSRVNSARIAAIKAEEAGLNLNGAVMASDAFFPFRDGIDTAAKVGIKAIIQPGGSMRDAEVIQAADEAGIAMVFTGMRHFWH